MQYRDPDEPHSDSPIGFTGYSSSTGSFKPASRLESMGSGAVHCWESRIELVASAAKEEDRMDRRETDSIARG